MTDFPTEDWAGEVGDRWLRNLDAFESMIAPVGRALIERAAFVPGERVVDIGCGPGANTFEIARAVAPGGRVTGVDVAPMLVDKAGERLAASGLDNVAFLCADAETASPTDAPFDRLFSRFGVMFFADTGAAFANMRGWLRPGADMIFSCWAAPEQNPWIALVGAVIGRHVEMPQRPPDAPGPFRLADAEATRALLERVGFDQVSFELWQGEQHVGGAGATPASAADFVLSAMGVSEPLRESGADVERVRAEIAEVLRPYNRDGAVRMAGTAWFVTARNPG